MRAAWKIVGLLGASAAAVAACSMTPETGALNHCVEVDGSYSYTYGLHDLSASDKPDACGGGWGQDGSDEGGWSEGGGPDGGWRDAAHEGGWRDGGGHDAPWHDAAPDADWHEAGEDAAHDGPWDGSPGADAAGDGPVVYDAPPG